MVEQTLQEKYIEELLDPRSALSPREVAAAEEIKELRRQLAQKQTRKPSKKAEKEQS